MKSYPRIYIAEIRYNLTHLKLLAMLYKDIWLDMEYLDQAFILRTIQIFIVRWSGTFVP